ncbi:hypothetical protein [Clostridium felsineum]|uniref:hypothetical protein n=1 Tax=Clostridium felsineum TaxID=36839 RepID=UPI00098C9DD0|nr:hypothetical protein [Clostridium felsineum]URZ14969.1 hypothetical protein CLFE_009820 [Clostridium felsineum DSM 794]
MNIKKIVALFITSTLSLSLLVGCGSNNATQNSNNTTTKKVDTTQIKAQYQSKLKELVTKSTITQAQSDKILTTLTNHIGKGHRRAGNKSNDSGANKPNNSGDNVQNNNKNNNRQNFNPLNSLVQNGIITQDQANTVWQTLRGSFNLEKNTTTNNQ